MWNGYAGSWTGTKRLYFEGEQGPMLASPSHLQADVVAGRFLQVRYTWVYEDKPREGALLLGAGGKAPATAAWVDSFHQSGRLMFCEGAPQESGVSVKGSYSAGDGPDWGWRIDLLLDGQALRLTMYNIAPDGQVYLAVAAEYTRA